ncbi:ENR1 protein, partial [Aegotheles bennettii]|nr:ENR1 protein [Aegotheles bennettii]
QGNNSFNTSVKCQYRNDSGAWYCKTDYITNSSTQILWEPYHPLGHGNHTYFQIPWTPEGLFPNGTAALEGHYWICGQNAYHKLPANWSGTCYIGAIRPLFFLLPLNEGDFLGVPIYDLQSVRKKRSVDVSIAGGSTQTWGKDEWTPQQIIKHYGPATWDPSELVEGVREPIHNLNSIIRLQAVLEDIINQTAEALDLTATQMAQMRSGIYQHRAVLDYLSAEEGGVCGKFDDSSCCLQIDDEGKAVQEIVKNIRNIAHVPVQTWKDQNIDFSSWLPGAPWLKRVLFFALCAIIGMIFLPCLIP